MGRVGLKGFFYLTHHGGSKKNSTQSDLSHKSNPTHMGRVGRVEPMDLTNFFIIIIKLSRKKNININILKKSKN